jgi:hypothetical protein
MIHCNSKNNKNKSKSRPTFYKDDHEIRAGGILFVKHQDTTASTSTTSSTSTIEVLLSLKQNRYEDIGGKTDPVDQSIYDTISREVQEETNGLITSYHVQKQLQVKHNSSHFIIHGKYLLYIIQANSFERNVTSSDFGETELLYDIPRTMHWVPIKQLSFICLHPRLPLKQIANFFYTIQPQPFKSKM